MPSGAVVANSDLDFERIAALAAVGGIDSEVAPELADPQKVLNLWDNLRPEVPGDYKFLAVCGTRYFSELLLLR